MFEFDRASGQHSTGLDRMRFKEICPLLIYQLDSGLCASGLAADADSDKPEIKASEFSKKPSPTEGGDCFCVVYFEICGYNMKQLHI